MMCSLRGTASSPFRVDLGMGGVSDLEWWGPSRGGQCLSLGARFRGQGISISAEVIGRQEIEFVGFEYGPAAYHMLICSNPEAELKKCPQSMRLPVASALVALDAVSDTRDLRIGPLGIRLVNNSIIAKGMGGSSAVSACLVLCVMGLLAQHGVSFADLVALVAKSENLAGIGGGWEDVAGIYKGGICRVVQKPGEVINLVVVPVDCDPRFLALMEQSLLIGLTDYAASTEQVLGEARMMFEKNPVAVADVARILQQECEEVVRSIQRFSLKEIGESLSRQRRAWNTITNGYSSNTQVSELMEPISNIIYGFREAGAGGGGTLLVVAKPDYTEAVESYLKASGVVPQNWALSTTGLTFEANMGE